MPETATEVPPQDEEKESMPTMGFLDHLEELRKRIIYSILAVAIGFFVCWGYADRIYDVMQRPIMTALRKHLLTGTLVYLNPPDPSTRRFKVPVLARPSLPCP